MKNLFSFIIFTSLILGLLNSNAYAAINPWKPTPAELETIIAEYSWVFQDEEIKAINNRDTTDALAELIFFYKKNLNKDIKEAHWEWNAVTKKQEYVKTIFTIKNKKYLTFVNFSSDSNLHRMYVLNMQPNPRIAMESKRIQTFLVSHGIKSSNPNDPSQARNFSNVYGSNMSSLGLYLTDISPWDGKNGFSVRMHGLENTNDQAFVRFIEIHGADYVNEKTIPLGTSEGCFAIDKAISDSTIAKLLGGSVLYAWIDPKLLPQQVSSSVQQPNPQIPKRGNDIDDENRTAGN